MLKNHKNILFSLIGIILAFFGYWYFFLSKKDTKKGTANSLLVNTISPKAQAPLSSYDKEFVANLQTVRYIDLNTELFAKASYKALSFPEVPFEVDYNIPAGRRNPFLPIGVEGNAGSGSVKPQNNDTSKTDPAVVPTAPAASVVSKPKIPAGPAAPAAPVVAPRPSALPGVIPAR